MLGISTLQLQAGPARFGLAIPGCPRALYPPEASAIIQTISPPTWGGTLDYGPGLRLNFGEVKVFLKMDRVAEKGHYGDIKNTADLAIERPRYI